MSRRKKVIRQNRQIRDELHRQTAYLQGPEVGKEYDRKRGMVQAVFVLVAIAAIATLVGATFHVIWYIEIGIVVLVAVGLLNKRRRG